ncbi:MAG: metallophosphoesterase [Firmicutes bacterium]|nr:metallophosphoesterase [Bacillota bacterium]
MKLLVISDTHGSYEKAVDLIKKGDYDAVIHLGDLVRDADAIRERTGAWVIGVAGNMDGNFSPRNYKVLKTEFGRILLVHGHREKVKSGLQNLCYRAEELDCRAVFFGHTHQAFYEEEGGLVLLNPGSLSLPYSWEPPSYAEVEITDDGELTAGIVYC